jgi:hypothetical protein
MWQQPQILHSEFKKISENSHHVFSESEAKVIGQPGSNQKEKTGEGAWVRSPRVQTPVRKKETERERERAHTII